jgi:hypothetical protein
MPFKKPEKLSDIVTIAVFKQWKGRRHCWKVNPLSQFYSDKKQKDTPGIIRGLLGSFAIKRLAFRRYIQVQRSHYNAGVMNAASPR